MHLLSYHVFFLFSCSISFSNHSRYGGIQDQHRQKGLGRLKLRHLGSHFNEHDLRPLIVGTSGHFLGIVYKFKNTHTDIYIYIYIHTYIFLKKEGYHRHAPEHSPRILLVLPAIQK